MSSILIDTTVFIHALRGNIIFQEFLEAHDEYALSYVTYGELLQGAKSNNEVKKVRHIVEQSIVHWGNTIIHKKACELVAVYGPSHGIGFFDALIASTAIEEKYTLITENLKHFKMIEGLKVEKPTF